MKLIYHIYKKISDNEKNLYNLRITDANIQQKKLYFTMLFVIMSNSTHNCIYFRKIYPLFLIAL